MLFDSLYISNMKKNTVDTHRGKKLTGTVDMKEGCGANSRTEELFG